MYNNKEKIKSTEKDISLLILYHDSNKNHIEAVLTSVYSQTKFPEEIILIDNSKNGVNLTNERIKIFKTHDTSRAKARNIGVNVSKNKLLVFLDGDTLLMNPFTLEKIQEYSKDFSHGYGAKRLWTYREYFENNKNIFLSKLKNKNFKWLIQNSFWPEFSSKNNKVKNLIGYSFPGNFGFVSKQLFDKIGGFDERFDGYGGEDDYFAYKLYLSDGNKFKNLFDIQVIHINHPTRKSNSHESKRNWELFEKIIKGEGVKSFNINILLGLPNFKGEKIIEWQK